MFLLLLASSCAFVLFLITEVISISSSTSYYDNTSTSSSSESSLSESDYDDDDDNDDDGSYLTDNHECMRWSRDTVQEPEELEVEDEQEEDEEREPWLLSSNEEETGLVGDHAVPSPWSLYEGEMERPPPTPCAPIPTDEHLEQALLGEHPTPLA